MQQLFARLASSANSVTYSGLFKINKNSSTSTPLVESRSQFTDLSKFYGSDYFFSELGINQSDFLMAQRGAGKDNSRILGDAFVEIKLLKDQILNLRNDALFLVNSETDFGAVANHPTILS